MSSTNDIIRDLRKSFKTQNQSQFDNAVLNILEKVDNFQKMMEIGKRVGIEHNKRYLEIVDVDSSTSKLTINPCDGRVTLKVSNKCSINVKRNMIALAQKLMSENIPPVTMRGRIVFKNNGYETCLLSESKHHQHSVRVEEKDYA